MRHPLTVNAPISKGILSSLMFTQVFAELYKAASSSSVSSTASPCSPFKNAISDFNAATSVFNLGNRESKCFHNDDVIRTITRASPPNDENRICFFVDNGRVFHSSHPLRKPTGGNGFLIPISLRETIRSTTITAKLPTPNCSSSGLIVAIITVLQLPPKLSPDVAVSRRTETNVKKDESTYHAGHWSSWNSCTAQTRLSSFPRVS
jgi:hypothetical protein